jgi:hypothetical protein
MSCEELRDHYELYALGIAEETEGREIREHLGRGCEVCMAEMTRARELASMLGIAAAPAASSPRLRRRILAAVGVEERRFGWTPFLAAALALSLVAAVYFGGRERQFALTAEQLRVMARRQNIELTRLNEAMAILNAADTVVTSFGAGQPQPPKGKVIVNPKRGVLLIASNLPPAPEGKTYEMWRIPKSKGALPSRAGEFQAETDGTALHIERGAVDPSALAAIAVTLENAGGAEQPTSQPVIVAALQ